MRTGLVTVDPLALLSSKDRLEYLSIAISLLEEFPFHILPQMTHLRTLQLTSNAIKKVSIITSSSLKDIFLFSNQIDALDPGWSTPYLESLDISEYCDTCSAVFFRVSMHTSTHFDALESLKRWIFSVV